VLGCVFGAFGGCTSKTSGAVDEVGGVTLVTTCGAADSSGIQSCDVVSEGQTLQALCGATSILFDQSGGTVTVNIPDLAASDVALSSGLVIEILAAAQGQGPAVLTVAQGPCPGCLGSATVPVGHDAAWVQVATVSGEGRSTLTLSGSGIEIDDLRMTGTTERVETFSHGCGKVPSFGLE
jgi:hypothetical protein